jgi:hypothetical protein
MDVTRTELQKHTKHINAVLQETCDATDPAPLIQLADGTIALATSCPWALRREVTSDLGVRETALRLPIPDTDNPRFWIAMQEQWQWISSHRARFLHCGLRLYSGERSGEAIQFLRLEWVAPKTLDGIPSYQGKHAGHPHWHIDRSVLIGRTEYSRFLGIPTDPVQQEAEEFSEAVTSDNAAARAAHDFSWLQKIHLPAHAQWMLQLWDGSKIPGPHQCEPNSLDELERWWAGALRYVSSELPH